MHPTSQSTAAHILQYRTGVKHRNSIPATDALRNEPPFTQPANVYRSHWRSCVGFEDNNSHKGIAPHRAAGTDTTPKGMPTPLAVWFRSRFAQGGSRNPSEEGPQRGFLALNLAEVSKHPEGSLPITEGSQCHRERLTLSLPEGFE